MPGVLEDNTLVMFETEAGVLGTLCTTCTVVITQLDKMLAGKTSEVSHDQGITIKTYN